MLGLGLGLWNSGVGGFAVREQIVASGGRFASDMLSSPTSSQLQLQTRRPSSTGGQPVSYFRLAYTGYGGPLETLASAAYTIEAAIEIPGAPNPGPFRAKFSGSNTHAVQPGENAVSDQIAASQFGYAGGTVPANTAIFIRDNLVVGGTGTGFAYPILGGTNSGTVAAETGAQQFYSPVTASQVMSTGNMTTPAGGAAAAAYTPLIAVLGAFTGPEISILMVGDSIMNWKNDTRNIGVSGASGGMFVRPTVGVNGRNIPWSNIAIGGDQATQFAANHSLRSFLFPYATHAVCDYGTNDISIAGRSAAQIIGDLRTIWAALKAGGLRRVEQMLLLPHTSGAWTLADGSDQTPVTFFTNGSVRDTLNTSIASNVGSNGLDATIDLSSALQLSGDHTRWNASGSAGTSAYTADGLHPFGKAFVGGSPATACDLIATRYGTYV